MGISVIQPWHLILIVIIALIVFGPSKLGDVGGQLGRAVHDFKKTVNEGETSEEKPAQAGQNE